MDPSELRYLEDNDTPTMKVIKGAAFGLVSGTLCGAVDAYFYDVLRVERSVALTSIRTLKMMGNYGLTFAAIGGVYIGVEQLLQNYRMKRDFFNSAIGGLVAYGGFLAGATALGSKGALGYKGKNINSTVAALAVFSAVIDGQTTRIDTGKEKEPS